MKRTTLANQRALYKMEQQPTKLFEFRERAHSSGAARKTGYKKQRDIKSSQDRRRQRMLTLQKQKRRDLLEVARKLSELGDDDNAAGGTVTAMEAGDAAGGSGSTDSVGSAKAKKAARLEIERVRRKAHAGQFMHPGTKEHH